MLLQSTLAITGLAALSSAILLPPNVVSDDNDVITTLPFDIISNADSQSIDLFCPGCPVPVGHTPDGARVMMTQGPDSKLTLDFEIHHLRDSDVLTLNDVQLFPVDPVFSSEPLTALQTIPNPHKSDDNGRYLPDLAIAGLGYESKIQLLKAPTEKEQLALYSIQVQIVEVDGKWVEGLQAVEAKIILTSSGGLLISDIVKTASNNPVLAAGEKCSSMACRIHEMITAKIANLRKMKSKGRKGGCGGKKGKILGHLGAGGHASKGHGKTHGDGKYAGHRDHRVVRLLHALKSVALHVLIPVSIGIIAGMTASFIGMIVGHAIVFLWRTLYRRGQAPAYTRIEGQEDNKLAVEELEAPPAYADEKDVIVVVVDEKEQL